MPYMPERSDDLTTNAFRIAIGSCILAPIFASARKRNFMNPLFLLLSALLLLTPGAEAATWHTLQSGVQVTLQADEPQLEAIDKNATDKEKKKDKKLKVWDKITYSRPRQAMPGDFYYTAAKSMTEINCTARTLKSLRRIYYDSDGNEIKSIHYGSSEPGEAVVPDTSGESVFNFACAFKAANAVAKTTPSPKSPAQAKTSQPPAKSDKSKEKAKEPQKPQAAASAKPSAGKHPPLPLRQPGLPTRKKRFANGQLAETSAGRDFFHHPVRDRPLPERPGRLVSIQPADPGQENPEPCNNAAPGYVQLTAGARVCLLSFSPRCVHRHRQVQVGRGGQAQQALQIDLARRRIEQVGAAHDVADPLLGIVHHHRQLVGEQAIGAAHDEIADLRCQGLADAPLQAIVESDRHTESVRTLSAPALPGLQASRRGRCRDRPGHRCRRWPNRRFPCGVQAQG